MPQLSLLHENFSDKGMQQISSSLHNRQSIVPVPCEEPLVSHLSVCPVSSLVLCMSRICGGNIQQMESWHLKPFRLLFAVAKDCTLKKGCMLKIWILISLSQQMAHSAGVVAAWDLSDMSLQQIFSLLYDGCWNSESYLLVPNKIQSLVSLRLAL